MCAVWAEKLCFGQQDQEQHLSRWTVALPLAGLSLTVEHRRSMVRCMKRRTIADQYPQGAAVTVRMPRRDRHLEVSHD
jgi:hypothetical protein